MQEPAKREDDFKDIREAYLDGVDDDAVDYDDIPVVDSDVSASINLRRIATRQAEINRIEKLRDAEVNRITEVFNHEIEKLEKAIRFFRHPLEDYMFAKNRENPKTKTMTFSEGKLCLRKKPDRIEIVEGANPEEYKADDNLVREKTTWEFNKKAIKAYLDDHEGEELPYATKIEGETVFKIELYSE